MRTHQKASEVLRLPTSNYKLQNTNFGVSQYMCKYALLTLTGGGTEYQCLCLILSAYSCVWSPLLLKGKKPNNKQCGDLCLKMTVLLILCYKYILIHFLMTVQLWTEKATDKKHRNWIQNASECLQEVRKIIL